MSFRPEQGMERLKEQLEQRYENLPEEFYLLEARFEKNQRNERLFGDSDPSTRGEANRLILDLNRFALEHLEISFNELCQSPPTNIRPSLSGPRLVKSSSPSESVATPTGTELLGIKKHWAVLVGVGKYDDERYNDLPLCLHDVTAVEQVLYNSSSNTGFTRESLCVLTDNAADKPTADNIRSALKTMAGQTEPDDLLLFYYTGHGDFAQNESYLVAQDGMFDNLKETALAISQVTTIMRSAPARAKVMILDACHSGANLNSKGPRRMHPKYLERVFHQAKGMATLASCDQDQLSYPWEKQMRSVYTYFLLEALRGKADPDKKGFVSVDDIHHYVTNGVASWVENKDRKYMQTPTRSIESSGDIIVCFYPNP
jgi:Caspase domain